VVIAGSLRRTRGTGRAGGAAAAGRGGKIETMAVVSLAYEVGGWGTGEVWLDGDVLVYHSLPHRASGPPRASSRFERNAETRTGGKRRRNESATTHPVVARLAAYFGGEQVDFADVRLEQDGWTPFQRAVAAALRSVPYGDVVTYGELAALAGHPNAHRAVGSFCARNRFPIVVPCHRVVSATGVGPFGALGVGYKRRLLNLEHVAL
jgi:methylated-DNA-[protein]-cysteine S-methyltransferase